MQFSLSDGQVQLGMASFSDQQLVISVESFDSFITAMQEVNLQENLRRHGPIGEKVSHYWLG